MASAKKAVKKAARPRASARKVDAPVAASAPVHASAAAPKRSKALILVGLVLFIGIIAQGAIMMRANWKKNITLEARGITVPMGRDADGVMCCSKKLQADHKGNLVVLEESVVGGRLQKFTREGKFLVSYKPGKKDPAVGDGVDIACDSKDNVYVLMRESHTVHVLSPELKYLRSFQVNLANTGSIAINSKDEVLIGGSDTKVIGVHDLMGKEKARFDGDKFKLGIPHRMTIGADDEVYVLNMASGNGNAPEVQVFSSEGKSLRHWMVKGLASNPYNTIAYHPGGFIFVNDNSGNSLAKGLYIYTKAGRGVGMASVGDNGSQFLNITSFTIDPSSGDIFLNTNFYQHGVDRYFWNGKL